MITTMKMYSHCDLDLHQYGPCEMCLTKYSFIKKSICRVIKIVFSLSQ